MSKKILLIEDDKEICDLLKLHLTDLDFQTEVACNGLDGLNLALNNNYELVLLDILLPKMDGFEVCRSIREKNKGLPIVMLTAKSEEFDKILGLELGADDYITKPFSIREVMARIKSILRRVKAFKNETVSIENEFEFGNLYVNVRKRKVTINNIPIDLTAKEFDLLKLFISNPGKAFSREELLAIVWGYQFSGYEHTVNSHINRLRAKIENDPSNPQFIKTVWGIGYKFAEDETQ